MIRLELDPTEGEILRLVLEHEISELGMEIADTDSMDYREKLKARREVLRRVVTGLREGQRKGAGG